MSKDKLFLIDSHAICYRCFYAIRDLTTSKGQPTNAILGVIKVINKLVRVHNPKYMAFCFDSPKRTRRREKYDQYKIHRASMPDDLIAQMPIIKEVIQEYNFPIFEVEGFEADDLIATFVKQGTQKGLEVVIVSDDKDMYQLLGEDVKVFSPRKDCMLDYGAIKDKLGFSPDKIVDFIGLAGDKADNIPGVDGIGEVTARKLIQQYGDLENILANLDTLTPPKVCAKIKDQKDGAILSKELAILEENVVLTYDLKMLEVCEPNKSRLVEIFKELEFKTLAVEFSQEQDKAAVAQSVQVIENQEQMNPFLKGIQNEQWVVFWVSTDQLMVALGDKEIGCIALDKVNFLKGVFEDKAILKITYDIKEARKTLLREGHMLKGKVFDIMLAGYVLNPSTGTSAIDELAWEFLRQALPKEVEAAQGLDAVVRLYPLLKKALEEHELSALFHDLEMPLADVLFKMETQGVNIDVSLLKELSSTCDQKIQELTKEIYALAGREFNINSPKQLSQILFNELNLPVIKKTKTGFSTNEEVLTKLSKKHEVPSLILDYRQLAKLKSTYIDALPKLINSDTGRIHAIFLQIGTETGRLSSRHPNLQNIPIRTEFGRQIRKAIIPSKKDLILIASDYSQIELRILAHLSKDKNLIGAFLEGQDIHQFTASLMFDVSEDEVTSQMRNSAKRVNFGIVYGISAFGLSKDLKIPQTEAQEFIDKYFLRYPQIREFISGAIEECQKKGYVTTLLHRRRYIPEINSSNMAVRQFAERQAMNTPVQGSAADLIKLAMISVQSELEKQKFETKMLITVHDELVFEAPSSEKDDMIKLIRQVMEHAMVLDVPLDVSMKAGKNWLEMEKI